MLSQFWHRFRRRRVLLWKKIRSGHF